MELLFSSLLLFLLGPIASIARGGDRIPNPSGFWDRSGEFSARSLLQDHKPQELEALADGYMSNSELEKAIEEFGKRCAHISRVYSIGKSVKGFPLLVIEISDKPGKDEAEPAFKFIGNVHGDEPVGRELLILLANWLCNNYMKDSLATLIIKNVHLHILPTMNPDGFALRRRGNANNVDLNRDFPDQFFPINDVVDLRQPETRAVMSWIKGQHFTASASLHGGALVANYPWDGSGDSRYPIYGGMQDWNYIHGGCLELTLEISDDKWPKADELPILFEYNRMSMLNLVASLAKTGIHGRIFSSHNGHPLPASVMIKGIDYKINASGSSGDYHRILAPSGSYEVTVSMPGYRAKTTPTFLQQYAISLDFILDPDGDDAHRRTPLDGCDCNCLGILRRAHGGVYLAVFVILLFLYFLLKRKAVFRFLKRRHSSSHRRVSVV
ncbi:uncharacterized protein A4U43_C01F22240 [Asparagus officinalis]|uniref:Peptidase M14 domain-containing protein n=1 Tax=Asparagus officinalis TaxID=4686 RepID=A0A5P1FVL7_ASPOF|nr:uncharacterized protein A4U43_C01F22240 [Asparagus officinalis]